MAGPMLQYAPGMASAAGNLATKTGLPGLGAGLASAHPKLDAARNFIGASSANTQAPPAWYNWMKNTPTP